MDGMNPTLAFAALLFGLSGNPQDAPDKSPVDAQIAERPVCASVAGNHVPQGADPVVRQYMPAANTGPLPEHCKPER